MARKSKSVSTRNRADNVNVAASVDGLAVSDLRIRLEFLERDNEKLLKQIEKKRTELNNLLDRIREIGVEVAQRSAPILQQLLEIDGKIHAIFTEIFNGRKLAKQTRKNIEKIYYTLQISGLISQRHMHSGSVVQQEDLDDKDDWGAEDFFGRQRQSHFNNEVESPQIDRDELKKIRQIFLRLADVFHPDKTIDEQDCEYRTEVMKEINQAYQAGDLAKLLAIEKQHQMGEIIDRDSGDDLIRRCARIEQENEFLNSQFTNLKQEIWQTKNTPQGSIVAEYKKLTKAGVDPIGEMVAETESQIEVIAEIHQFAIDFRDKKITVKDFMKGPAIFQQMQQVSAEDLLMDLFGQF
ncbi:J domain-containing protein [Chamaesiphon sp. VAR_48_metabat_135_sub]|uniref:J domain-containing protein n=1 Tax=Chamaesiphon sp. VAR_48_metabat_135_sub TaxID=2964699 RepID=UPI00286B10C0|nr:J domain-containing protein [Chamaesiphon sp. VAR_48_metabat_135_sub]